MTDDRTIVFDNRRAREFRAAYKQALAEGKESFVFDGQEVLTSYGKYVCEFLVMQGILEEDLPNP